MRHDRNSLKIWQKGHQIVIHVKELKKQIGKQLHNIKHSVPASYGDSQIRPLLALHVNFQQLALDVREIWLQHLSTHWWLRQFWIIWLARRIGLIWLARWIGLIWLARRASPSSLYRWWSSRSPDTSSMALQMAVCPSVMEPSSVGSLCYRLMHLWHQQHNHHSYYRGLLLIPTSCTLTMKSATVVPSINPFLTDWRLYNVLVTRKAPNHYGI